MCIFARGYHKEKTEIEARTLHNFTDLDNCIFEKVPVNELFKTTKY